MKTIKMIDLLNKIVNGEEVPKQIKYSNKIYTLSNLVNDYMNEDGDYLTYKFDDFDILNDEVEILEEEPRDIEVCGSLFTKSEYDKLAHSEKPKKIPEKLKIEQGSLMNNFYIKNEFGTQCFLTKHSKILADKINEILDYLESKGDE